MKLTLPVLAVSGHSTMPGHSLNTQTLRVMRLTAFILLIGCLQVSARANSQVITFAGSNVPLEKLFAVIKQQTGYRIFCDYDLIKNAQPVTVRAENMPLPTLLEQVLDKQMLTWRIDEKNVLISAKITADLSPRLILKDTLIDITGRVVNEKNEPIPGVSILIKGSSRLTSSDDQGNFSFKGIPKNSILKATCISCEATEVLVNNRNSITFQLKNSVSDLAGVSISYNTGYQYIPKERATGSFVHVDNELFNRSVSTNILNRLNGVVSGVLFDANTGTSNGFNIRGRSTIFANTDPLIVLDNFPYDGALSTINPNDVESVTILKDAAAASIWGVRASNGVIVVTSKRGKYNQPMKVTVNSNTTVIEIPDLNARPDMSTSDIIDVEQFLFSQGYYNSTINTSYLDLTPVIEILVKKQNGTLTATDADAQINKLRTQSLKNDLTKYYYRKQVNQQYSLNISGGASKNKYYLSVGYDKNLQNIVNSSNDRISINAANTYSLIKNKLEINTGINFAANSNGSPASIAESNLRSPYIRLVDDQGNAQAVNLYRDSWIDTVGQGLLLDWKYRPLDELAVVNKSKQLNYLLTAGLRYRIINGLDIDVNYQYSKGTIENSLLNPQSSYYTRDLINQFTQINYTTKALTRPVPLGDIYYYSNIVYSSHNLRGKVSYNKTMHNGDHAISVLLGTELKKYDNSITSGRFYGYNEDLGLVAATDYVTRYKTIFTPTSTGAISGIPSKTGSADRYLANYGNASYTYKRRYTISGSVRKDESNIFGVNANQKGVPLWSAGASWDIAQQSFLLNSTWLNDLKLRVTYGYNGNVDKTVSAFTTANATSSYKNVFGEQYAAIVNPPNANLRWEKIGVTNIGLDFGFLKRRISGSFEYYHKTGKDIIGNSPLPPSSGVVTFKGNSADISGHGIDLTLNTQNITNRHFSWSTNLLFSYNTDKIVTYKVNTAPLAFRQGFPYNALFSWPSAGLDPTNGNPMGYLNGLPSTNWSTIIAKDSVKRFVYHGSTMPTYFGSIRNTIVLGNLTLSCNIIYKMGYYFRAASINYGSLLTQTPVGHKDYSLRWQKPGDEVNTTVPSLVYPANTARDAFYTNSEVLVQKGDQIRLQDVQASYDITHVKNKKLPVQNIRLYTYISNLGILWRANDKGIDPDNKDIPAQKSFSIGMQINF